MIKFGIKCFDNHCYKTFNLYQNACKSQVVPGGGTLLQISLPRATSNRYSLQQFARKSHKINESYPRAPTAGQYQFTRWRTFPLTVLQQAQRSIERLSKFPYSTNRTDLHQQLQPVDYCHACFANKQRTCAIVFFLQIKKNSNSSHGDADYY